jgi:glyoxylase-like metal-dependent hydrolase (beta-lactamase superfamily II)
MVTVLGLFILFGCQQEDKLRTGTVNEQVQNRGEGKDNWYDALPRAAWSEFPKIEQSQDWFEVYQVLPNVFAIYEPGQFEEVISYLIVGSERALLFDTGLGIGDMGRVVSELTDRGPIVLNSHTHYDHVGGNHQFEEIYGTDTEYTKGNARGRSHNDVKEFVGEGWIWKPLPDGFSPDAYHMEPFTIDTTVTDGHKIELGGRTLEVLLTPGHAPDSLCLLDRENRLLFMGDTFYPASLYAHLHGSDFEQYVLTATRLASLQNDVDFILPAHNEPLLESGYLVRFRDAFHTITDPKTSFVITDGNREYSFEDFSIIVPDPPPWSN